MARFHAWAILAVGVCGIGANLSYAGGKPAPAASDANAPVATLKLTPVASEDELVTPPLVIGNGSACGDAGCACRHPLWEWLTYTSSRPGLCHCHLDCAPCQAPLYAYFPCTEGGCAKAPRCAVGANLLSTLQQMACWRPEFPRMRAFRLSITCEHVAASGCDDAPACRP